MYTYLYIDRYICIYIYIYIHRCIYIYVILYIYIYTRIHNISRNWIRVVEEWRRSQECSASVWDDEKTLDFGGVPVLFLYHVKKQMAWTIPSFTQWNSTILVAVSMRNTLKYVSVASTLWGLNRKVSWRFTVLLMTPMEKNIKKKKTQQETQREEDTSIVIIIIIIIIVIIVIITMMQHKPKKKHQK